MHLNNLLFSCYFTIHHSEHLKLIQKSHFILKFLIKKFTFPTSLFEKIKNSDLLEEIKSEDRDLCIATIYTHILYRYFDSNNNIVKISFMNTDKK